MTRHRVTIRGDGTELRGYIDDEEVVVAVAEALQEAAPSVVVVVSHAPDNFNPFALDEL